MCPIVHFSQCGLPWGVGRYFLDHDEHSCCRDLDTCSLHGVVWQYEVLEIDDRSSSPHHICMGEDAGSHPYPVY